MPDRCSCGTILAPDSVFCHKCGKPQREVPEYVPEPAEDAVVEAEAPVAAPVAAVVDAPPVNFHNRLALQIGLLMAVLATLLSFMVYVNWVAAGYFAVVIYKRRTGRPLNLEAGVRMGWITGILMFLIMMIILTVSMAFIASGALNNLPADARAALDPRVQEALKTLQSGPAVVELLIMLFIFTTLLSMAGGALGAKLSSRSSQ